MIPLTLEQIRAVVAGRLEHGSSDTVVTGNVEFDSRKIHAGDLFVALAGARVDGHDFVAQTIEQGAVAALTARSVGESAIVVPPVASEHNQAYAFAHDTDGSVAAVLAALSKLARHVVDTLDVTVVGVTGSAGKTSTKDMMATVFAAAGPTVAPPGSFNNEIGHPYTVLRCTHETQYLIAELSARGKGHIAKLAEIAPPTIGVVLNVGSAHVGEFGSQENIAAAKGELVEALPADGVAVLNADDPLVAAMASRTQARVLYYSTTQPVDVYASDIVLDESARARFTLHFNDATAPIALQVHGEHQVSNALAAAAAALAAGIPFATVAAQLSAHTAASEHRMDVQVRADGLTVVDDSYNANPDSMRAALTAAVNMRTPQGRVIAVLGPMGELGVTARNDHEAVIEYAHDLGVDAVMAIGEHPDVHAYATRSRQLGIPCQWLGDAASGLTALREYIQPHDVVLVKASNAAQLWTIASGLLECAATPSGSNGQSGQTCERLEHNTNQEEN
ncbi:UDP-N-acetylmuramoyl-tripeptide--D-alanyl-D-alanine ligase [Corynebacterium sp. HS2168-gen11]|uniref:UDP-N-acetylmuramoyl-tripeptide--D-alanyl-D- alanine ligase n=1 Tax=Corynebacterium sp. HS2168-gen11 TaxID=2974027 RepID=UPI00216B381F|nr:UDP-N-acetylmuramoyl-tripeptide--D-alanyl-D-alanine ligase [Corynebacterium sp. HS2168-gen11]MCS4536190.1 UDP-N-acetylmuramoyl-tripeptide--D-alanyl-D-alanine ligase [Corynebacterium sp. HS2168-gen11]